MGESIGQTFVGNVNGAGHKVAIVVSRFNDMVSERLLSGARDTLVRHGVAAQDIAVAWVPGAYEIPPVAKRLAQSGRFDGVVCLGAVIRGATPHFDFVAGQAAGGIAQVALETGVPTSFGVLTTETLDQALERAGSKAGNKGADAAATVIEMIQLLRVLPSRRG